MSIITFKSAYLWQEKWVVGAVVAPSRIAVSQFVDAASLEFLDKLYKRLELLKEYLPKCKGIFSLNIIEYFLVSEGFLHSSATKRSSLCTSIFKCIATMKGFGIICKLFVIENAFYYCIPVNPFSPILFILFSSSPSFRPINYNNSLSGGLNKLLWLQNGAFFGEFDKVWKDFNLLCS